MADKALEQVARWRAAHPGIEVNEAALLTMAPFASLYANDFIVYAEQKGVDPAAVQFVRDTARELVWAYDNWQKAQETSDRTALFRDIMNAARAGSGGEELYTMVSKFLRDYAAANNIALDEREVASWEKAFAFEGEVQGPTPIPENPRGEKKDAQA